MEQGRLTYKLDRYDRNGNPILKTYYLGAYVGESIGFYIGRDTILAYPLRFYYAPPAGIPVKNKVYTNEI